jgi:hypothetical protein
MSDTHMVRVAVDDGTWRAFRAMCMEQDVDVSKRLGEIVSSAVQTHNRAKRQPARASRRIR